MERLRTPGLVRARLWRVARRQTLDDLAQFSGPDFVGEIPLYSRYSEIGFLEEFGRGAADRVLLAFGLDYLDKLRTDAPGPDPLLMALTVERTGRSSPIVPKIFVCRGANCRRLAGHLVLSAAISPLSKSIGRDLRDLDPDLRFQMLEDRITDPRNPRVFLGFRPGPGLAQMTIDELGVVAAEPAGV